MPDPATLLAAASVGIAGAAFGLQGGTAARKYRRDHKHDQAKSSQGNGLPSGPFYHRDRTIEDSLTIGTGFIASLPDGTVIAGRQQQGDVTFGTIRNTTTISLGSGRYAKSERGASQFLGNVNNTPSTSQLGPMLLMQMARSQTLNSANALPNSEQRLLLEQKQAEERVTEVYEYMERPPAYEAKSRNGSIKSQKASFWKR